MSNSDSKSTKKIHNIDFVISMKLEEYVYNFKVEEKNLKPLLTTNHSWFGIVFKQWGVILYA